MRTTETMRKAWERIISALAEFDYLTPAQIARLLYAPSSRNHVYERLRPPVDRGLVQTLGGRDVNLPLLYTLSGTGRRCASTLGAAQGKRFRPSEEADKRRNPYFLKHSIAVIDVLIAARLLSDRVPAIQLSRMYTERELKRKIYIPLGGKTVCLEPDAGLLFHTPALSIAVIAVTEHMAATLKRWTEEVLTDMEQQAEGEWFFFCSVDPATTSPEEMFLAP